MWLPACFLQPSAFADAPPANIEVFVQQGCPHCTAAEAFLEVLKREQPALNIVIHDIKQEPFALAQLQRLAENQGMKSAKVPAFQIGGQLIFGYSEEAHTGLLIRNALKQIRTQPGQDAGSCSVTESLSCEAEPDAAMQTIDFFGRKLSLDDIGLPLFTLAIGLLDGFNPCSIWVLVLMISLLASMNDRARMLAVAGTFVAVEGLVYFIFMAAWLNLFLLIGLSRASEIAIAVIALLVGLINLKDFRFYGLGFSLKIPDAAKPGIYARLRKIIQSPNLLGAMLGAVVLAVLVQIVEFMCTSGFPALYTRILTMKQLDDFSYYGYLLLYNAAYMFDDVIVLTIGVVTLSQRRLQEKEGRWLKLVSGLAMVGIGVYLLLKAGYE
nr:glutaredoxin domain-containing protein [Candidatus Methylobacter oryzae]